MKVIVLFLLMGAAVLHAQPVIQFENVVHDFGSIPYNGNGEWEFKFWNIGNEPLIIQSATGSCGCTVATWPKEPIAPKRSAVIKTKYDTKRIGRFEKTFTVTSNSACITTILKIKGAVFNEMTEITLNEDTIDLGAVKFNEKGKAQFYYTNQTKNTLIWGCYGNVIKDDCLICTINDFKYGNINPESQSFCASDGCVEVEIRNIFGNTGKFIKRIRLNTNTAAETILTVVGEFTGSVTEDTLVNQVNAGEMEILYYKKGKLKEIACYEYGNLARVKKYIGANLSSIQYCYNGKPVREEIFSDGKLVEHKILSK